jgi:hypothetical protein
MSTPTKATQYIQSFSDEIPTAFERYFDSNSSDPFLDLLTDLCSDHPLSSDEEAFLYEIYYNDPILEYARGDEQDEQDEQDIHNAEQQSETSYYAREDEQGIDAAEQQSEALFEKYLENMSNAEQRRIQARLRLSSRAVSNRFECLGEVLLE